METLPTLSLDMNWKCSYFQGDPNPYAVFVPSHVHSLTDWSCDERVNRSMVAHLFHLFYLEPTDFCVSYMLHIESAPGIVKLTLNERDMGEFDGTRPLDLDVTNAVKLEHNLIGFKVDCGAAGKFGAVYLQQIPCE